MGYLIADDSLLYRLCGLLEPVEIRDPSGNVLGHYTPLVSPELAAQYERAKDLFDLEEAELLAKTERTGYTIEEVMQYLKTLEEAELSRATSPAGVEARGPMEGTQE